MTKPKLDFTIEDLLQEAIATRQRDETDIFTTKELSSLWGLTDSKAAYRCMDKLSEAGWQFIPTRKFIVDRSGRHTNTIAYKPIPPNQKASE